jgi:hypothetical protein
MTAPANPPPTPTTPADAGTPPDPMRDVLACGLVRTLAARLASAERERDRLREEVREFELNENCRAKG